MKTVYLFIAVAISSIIHLPHDSNAQEITEEYLEGPWCYTHSLSGNERNEEMRTYIFTKGGKYSHQTSRMSEKMNEGFSYQILPGALKLKPEFPGELKIKSVSKDQMVLNWFVDLYFKRGKCE